MLKENVEAAGPMKYTGEVFDKEIESCTTIENGGNVAFLLMRLKMREF